MSTTIRTIERRPKVGEARPPLLLLLHGYGSNEHDLMSLAPYFDPRLHIVAARGLLEIGFGGAAWYQLSGSPGNLRPDPATRSKAISTLESFVRSLPERLGSDPQRTFLLGFSQGAIMSLALAMRIPEQIAGIVPVSGYFDLDLAPTTPPAALAQLKILQLHGVDDAVIPIAAARKTRDYLATTPAQSEYIEYPIGHSIHPDGLARIATWLQERIEEPRP